MQPLAILPWHRVTEGWTDGPCHPVRLNAARGGHMKTAPVAPKP